MCCRVGVGVLLRSSFPLAALSVVAALVAGCGFTPGVQTSSGSLNMQGTVMGGQQPIVNAHVALYVAGTGGNGSAASNLMGTGTNGSLTYTTTDANGKFSLQGDYTCPAATSSYTPQAYVAVTGGNPGLDNNRTNSAIVLMTALGNCSTVGSRNTITVNEVTTVAAAWALAPFMTSYANLGSSSTNGTGIANAFLNAQLIADPTTGTAPGSALTAINNTATAGTVSNTLETAKVYALADIIGTCINSDGTTNCSNLYNAIGLCSGSCTSDTLTAALYVVKHPAQNVAAAFALILPEQPYPTSLTLPPNDWTLSMTINGGGLNKPTALGVDNGGNVWVGDYYGAVSAFSPQGATLASPSAYPNGFGYGTSAFGAGSGKPAGEIYGLTVDTNNNIWVDLQQAPGGTGSIVGLNGITSGNALGSIITSITSSNIDYPEALAAAPNGEVLIGNNGDGTASIFTYTPSTGNYVFNLGNAGNPLSSEPSDISGDLVGGAWLADTGGNTVTHVDASGNIVSHPNCCAASNGIATDKLGNAWVSNYYEASLSEVAPGCDGYSNPGASCYHNQANQVLIGVTSSCGQTGAPAGSCGAQNGGLYYPQKVVIDAAQNIWVVNLRGETFSELAGNFNTLAPGTGISPATTYNSNGSIAKMGGYGLDANMLEPYDLATDASGNIWVTSEANNNIVLFFGLATPTATPRVPIPAAP